MLILAGPPDVTLPVDCHPKIRALLAYWLSKRGDRTMPGRRDIDPIEMAELLPNLFLVDVPEHGPLTYRLAGTGVEALLGHYLTGRAIGDGMQPGYREEAIGRYARIVAEARPFYHRTRLREHANDFADVERLVLPLSSDGLRINMLLGMTIRQLDARRASLLRQ